MKLRKILMGFVLQNGESPLYMASQNGHLDVVKTLIQAGANINQVTKVSTHIPTCASLLFKVIKLHHHVSGLSLRPTWTTLI